MSIEKVIEEKLKKSKQNDVPQKEEKLNENGEKEQSVQTKSESKGSPQDEPKKEVGQKPTEEPNEWQTKYQELEKQSSNWQNEIGQLKSKLEEDPFANEYIKNLNEKAKSGIDVDSEDFWKWQGINLDSYNTSEQNSALNLIRMEMELSNPNLDADEIEYKIKRTYKDLFDSSLDKEDESDAAIIKDALMQLRIDAKSALPKLQSHKDKLQLPKYDLTKKQAEEEAAKKAIEAYQNDVKVSTEGFSKLTVKAGDTELEYQPTEEDKKFIESSLINDTTLFTDLWVNKDESGNTRIDFNKAMTDLIRIKNFDRYVKMAYDQGVSAGKESEVNSLENVDDKTDSKQSKTPTASLRQKAIEIARQQRF